MSYQRDGGGRQAIPTTSRQGGSLLQFTVKYVQCRSRKGAASDKGEDERVGAGERAGAGDSHLQELRNLAPIASQLLAVCTMLQLNPPNQSENLSVSLLSLLPLLP